MMQDSLGKSLMIQQENSNFKDQIVTHPSNVNLTSTLSVVESNIGGIRHKDLKSTIAIPINKMYFERFYTIK
jgi:hypothetical protein